MIYGRRIIQHKPLNGFKSRRFRIIDESFQYKYALYLIAAVGGAAVAFMIPAAYFLNQNYSLIKELAFDHAPTLLDHLEREVLWLNMFMVISALSSLSFVFVIAIKLTGRLIAPMMLMQRHLKKLSLGEWSTPDLTTRDMDDFKDVVSAYNYFYNSLKANTEAELKTLEKLAIDPDNREAYAAWKTLLMKKRQMLGIETQAELNDFSEVRTSSHSSRRAS